MQLIRLFSILSLLLLVGKHVGLGIAHPIDAEHDSTGIEPDQQHATASPTAQRMLLLLLPQSGQPTPVVRNSLLDRRAPSSAVWPAMLVQARPTPPPGSSQQHKYHGFLHSQPIPMTMLEKQHI
ncbi:hypothetical protein SYNPS1DRAFT_30472 [Syncephalis pseudoplumigaleata]|uniref:Secreted protein n=1 Tax=Syncephalis pseudoplumigaleata TaxID=1712513 RepID=A0A4P9YUR2_9FUNG|nr:hypothetical protein SYNPS1DRAFT_30472 [Syncephalis pseudoplumigaleata]|eukprot:RKP23773.1 hypothetical protein SYNPS1DRAFT_30472 [Syncephalis pseudoplumigaleata]